MQTDVYSLGVVLYELLVGDVPFPGENFVSVAMKHVHEPPPNLPEVRKDVPHRVAAAVDRALEKDPAARFPTMDAFAAEIEACLAALDSPGDVDEGATIVSGKPIAAPPRRPRKQVSRWAVGFALLGMLALAAVIVGLLALQGIHVGGGTPASQAATIHLRGIGSWDPFGNNHEEHSSSAPNATDHKESTYWNTEHYNSFTKRGVGLVLDAGRPVKPHGITIKTGTPGFTAEIQAGSDTSGASYHPVSIGGAKTINGETTLELDLHSAQRYFVVWITKLPPGSGVVEINEVTAS